MLLTRQERKSLGVSGLQIKPKMRCSPNLAAYLVEVIFIIREPLKEKATCTREGNKRMW